MRKTEKRVGRSMLLALALAWALWFILSPAMPPSTFAQTVSFRDWLRTFNNGNGAQEPNAIAVDSLRNVYVTGFSRDAALNLQYETIKYSPTGTLLGVRNTKFGGGPPTTNIAFAIAVDANDNVFVTGQCQDPPPVRLVKSDLDTCTVSYTPDGAVRWMRDFDSNQGDDVGTAVAIDSAGRVFVTSTTFLAGNISHLLVYSNAGALMGAVALPAALGDARDVAIGLDDDLLIAFHDSVLGSIRVQTYTFNPAAVGIALKADVAPILVAPPAGGNYRFGGIAVDRRGQIFVGGVFSANPAANGDTLAAKFDRQGNERFNRIIDGSGDGSPDGALDVAVNSFGDPYFVGFRNVGGVNQDFQLLQLQRSGGAVVERVHVDSGAQDVGVGVAIDRENAVVITGWTGPMFGNDYQTVKFRPYPFPRITSVQLLGNSNDLTINFSTSDVLTDIKIESFNLGNIAKLRVSDGDRSVDLKPIVVTSNDDGDALTVRLSEDNVAQLVSLDRSRARMFTPDDSDITDTNGAPLLTTDLAGVDPAPLFFETPGIIIEVDRDVYTAGEQVRLLVSLVNPGGATNVDICVGILSADGALLFLDSTLSNLVMADASQTASFTRALENFTIPPSFNLVLTEVFAATLSSLPPGDHLAFAALAVPRTPQFDQLQLIGDISTKAFTIEAPPDLEPEDTTADGTVSSSIVPPKFQTFVVTRDSSVVALPQNDSTKSYG